MELHHPPVDLNLYKLFLDRFLVPDRKPRFLEKSACLSGRSVADLGERGPVKDAGGGTGEVWAGQGRFSGTAALARRAGDAVLVSAQAALR